MIEITATFSGAQADAVGRLIAEIEKLKAQRDAALAEVERLLAVIKPVTDKQPKWLYSECNDYLDKQSGRVWYKKLQEAKDFVAMLNKERSK